MNYLHKVFSLIELGRHLRYCFFFLYLRIADICQLHSANNFDLSKYVLVLENNMPEPIKEEINAIIFRDSVRTVQQTVSASVIETTQLMPYWVIISEKTTVHAKQPHKNTTRIALQRVQ